MLHKRLDKGCNGYRVPFVPKAARSSRKRGHVKTEIEDNQMCAFDLLASVAGTLLHEGESCQDECSAEDKSLNHEDVMMNERCEGKKLEYCEQGNADVPPLSLSLGLDDHVGRCTLKDSPGPQHDLSLAPPFITMSDCFKNNCSLDKIDLNSQSGLCGHLEKQVFQFENHLPVMNDSIEQHDCGPELTLRIGPDTHSSEDSKFFDRKPHALVTCDSGVKPSVDKDQYPPGSLSSPGGSNVKLVRKDDVDSLSECTQPSTMKTNRSLARIGDRRIRKLLASKYWRVASNRKDTDRTDNEMHCVYRSRKMGFKRQRSQRIYPFKKRKLYHYNSVSIRDGDFGSKGAYNSSEKAIDTNASCYGVDGPSSRVAGHSTTLPCRESHVKLRIRSFQVPEFFIEMPETATIGSLKRAVMETVTALLGGGLHVGVVLQGKKIRDDSRTLLQSGICHDDKLDSLGFTLEPNPTQTCQPVCSQDKSLLLSDNVTEPLSRFPGTGSFHLATSQVSSDHPGPVPNLGNLIDNDRDSFPLPAEISTNKDTVGSQALIAVPDGTPQALAVVPANQKSKQSDIGQRRIRRPFSVAEVEALVQAVEMLGTGRWRDVKLKAFDNVKHRTYVDLKDKWKTLVHTARIAPQQRRGQPVPQELLDRVLAVHAYWSQQQQPKQPSDAGLP